MDYAGREYRSTIDATGKNPVLSGSNTQIREGDIFRVVAKHTGRTWVCEILPGAYADQKFLAAEGWLDTFCILIEEDAKDDESTEPECHCYSPAMHEPTCAFMLWRQEQRKAGLIF